MAKILLANGPNLNLLGEREPELYGSATLADIENEVREIVEGGGHNLWSYQSNSEGALVDWLQQQRGADFLLINAGALTHTSISLRDVLAAGGPPFVEIHISNLYKRESFRHHSYLSDLAVGLIVGLGAQGYSLAARFAVDFLSRGEGGESAG